MDLSDTRLIERLCADLPMYARHALTILDKSGKQQRLILNRAQQYIHDRLEKQLAEQGRVRALILKSRQQGSSTYVAARFYHKTSTKFGQRAFIVAHEQKATDNLFSMVKRYHDNNPLKPSTGATNAKELVFDRLDGGYKLATAGSKDVGRSNTAQLLHGSEFGFWDNAESHLAGIGSCVADIDGTEIILESTANGINNKFHQLWQDAEAGRGEWTAIFVPWMWQQEYRAPVPEGFELTAEEVEYKNAYGCDLEQMVWRRNKVVTYGHGFEWLFDQEYPAVPNLAFRSPTADPIISPALVTRAMKSNYKDMHGPLIIGCDPAEFGDDRTAIVFRRGRVCYRIETYEKQEPMEVANRLARYHTEFSPDAMFVDKIGIGAGIVSRLRELGVPVIGINSGERASEPDLYVNQRAEMWYRMQEWFQDQPCRIPNDMALASDLSGPSIKYNAESRKKMVEKKEDMKRRGIRSPDCFIAGTLVSTPSGDRRIETMREGDEVLTPVGVRRVVKVWESETSELTTATFSNGSMLCGKGKHEVFTWDAGWVRMDALALDNAIESNNPWSVLKWKFLAQFFTPESVFGFKQRAATISRVGRVLRRDFFIGASGLTTSALFLKALLSITKTATGRTTESKTLNSSTDQVTQQSTCVNECRTRSIDLSHTRRLQAQESRPQHGTDRQTESRGTVSTENAHGKVESRPESHAAFAGKSTTLSFQRDPGSVQKPASKKHGISVTKRRLESVFCAVRNLFSTSFASRNVAPVSVRTDSVDSAVKVYNLTLDADNVYYANGILVANCADALALTFSSTVVARDTLDYAYRYGSHKAATIAGY